MTSLQSSPFNQCLIDPTVEVNVKFILQQNSIKNYLLHCTKTIILKSSVIITEKDKIDHINRFVYLYDLVPYKCKIPGRYE